MAITHAFVTTQPQSTDPNEVSANEWNAAHVDTADQALLWDDLQIPAQNGTGGTALSVVAFRDTPANLLAFADNALNKITFTGQMPHSWDPATAVHPHIHWIPLVTPGGTRSVVFLGQYVWARSNVMIPPNAGWTAFAVQATITAADAYKALITELAIVPPPTTAEASDILLIVLSRDGAHPSDDYTDGANNVGLLSVDIHYQKKSLNGTVTEY